MRGELSTAPGSDPSRMLLFFHGGGDRFGSIVSHRRMVTQAWGRAAPVALLQVAWPKDNKSPVNFRIETVNVLGVVSFVGWIGVC